MQKLIINSLRLLHFLVLAMVLYHPVQAQEPIDFQYVYDELGQLVKAIDSQGVVIEYVYDEVGNMLEIKRSTVQGLAIFGFAPETGPEGIIVEIQGQGFSSVPDDNVVSFNGTDAVVNTATANLLIVTVPPGVTTGPISVTVAGITAQSTNNFTLLQAPTITSITPNIVPAGATGNIQIQGNDLNAAQFSFQPLLHQINIISTATQPNGSAATLEINIDSAAINQDYLVLATNDDGSSSTTPTVSNTLNVVDGSTDADGDGLTLAQEFTLGTDPNTAYLRKTSYILMASQAWSRGILSNG